MLLIDYSRPPRHAFWNGFLKGMAAPLLLYGQFQAKATGSSVEWVRSVVSPNTDWAQVGQSMRRALDAYGRETSHS